MVLRSALINALSVTNFSLIRACLRVLMWILQSVQNEEEKKRRN